MKLFIDTGNIKEIESAGAARHHRRHHHQPVAPRQRRRATTGQILKKICQIVKGPVERRGGRDRRRRHDPRRARARRDRRAHRREGAVHARRRQGVQGAVVRRHAGQRHADASRRRRRCSPRRSARPTSARSSAGSTTSRPPAWSLIARSSRSTRTTSSRPRVLVACCRAPDSHRRSGADGRRHLHVPGGGDRGLFKHPLTDIGLEKFLKDWEKAQAVQGVG